MDTYEDPIQSILEEIGETFSEEEWQAFTAEQRRKQRAKLIAYRLWRERKILSLSMKEVAKRCGTSLYKWKKFENGEEIPDATVLLIFARIGADINYIFTGVKQPILSTNEQTLLALFRQADEKHQQIILSVAQMAQ